MIFNPKTMFNPWKVWRKENREKKNYNKNKTNNFKVHKLFLYIISKKNHIFKKYTNFFIILIIFNFLSYFPW